MKGDASISILAAFATLKSLNDERQYSSPYQLLSEFINYIICEKKLYSFTVIEMKNQLHEVFGFYIPEAVVNSAIKILDFVSKDSNIFSVDKEKIAENDKFQKFITSAENDNYNILKKIASYIVEKEPEESVKEDILAADLIAFLIDDQYKSTGTYTNMISEFVLKYEGDKEIQSALNAVREGSILYIGINHNINETGSLTRKITLFLDVEVLFSLVGFNGEIYKTLAQDFYNQVRIANTSGKKIDLKYFDDTRTEIDKFFGTAESIVEGKVKNSNKPAMREIVNGCATIADVQVKESDFFYKLQFEYGITQDSYDDYYAKELDQYNLESSDYKDEQDQEAWKFVSHINKLRKGKVYVNNLESENLFVTNTYNILKVSRSQTVKMKEQYQTDCICDFAVSVNRLTNILWYKLGNGFGSKTCPNNVSTVLKARLVLASNIALNVERVYNETTEQYKKGEITKEQLAARIITLRGKPVFPEELEGDMIDESMDFSTEYLSRYEEQVKLKDAALREKEEIIKGMEEQSCLEISLREKTIEEKENQIQERTRENKRLASELEEYRQKEEKEKERRERRKNWLLFLWSLTWKFVIVASVTGFCLWLNKKINNNYFTCCILAVDIISICGIVISGIKKDKKKYFPNDK